MEIPREITPVRSDDDCPPPAFLTPNSKIKALLANLDDSDSEPIIASARETLLAQLKKSPHQKPRTSASSNNTNAGEAITTDEEDFIRSTTKKVTNSEESGDKALRYTTYSSILTENRHVSPVAENISSRNEEPFDSSDEDIIPAITKRKINRYQAQGGPKIRSDKATASSSLFVSPHKHRTYSDCKSSDSESLPEDLGKTRRLMALSARKRLERQVNEPKALNDSGTKIIEEKINLKSLIPGEANESYENVAQSCRQQLRAPRKACKKSLEEINRETQRISRNQQLAHKAITKKKITKSSLFSKFNFIPKDQLEYTRPLSSGSGTPPSDMKMIETPPTSPISTLIIKPNTPRQHQSSSDENCVSRTPGEDFAIPPLENLGNHTAHPLDDLDDNGIPTKNRLKSSKNEINSHSLDKLVILEPESQKTRKMYLGDETDSELEIIEKVPILKKRLNDLFNRVPAKQAREPTALFALKTLAQLSSPSKIDSMKKSELTNAELQMALRQRARIQAIREREERLELLKAKGIIIQTSEEMEKEQSELDDMLSKAREEAEKLAKLEKSKNREANNKDGGNLIDDSSGDENYTDTEEKSQDEISISGSDDIESVLDIDENINKSQQEDRKFLDDSRDEKSIIKSSPSDQKWDSQNQDNNLKSSSSLNAAVTDDIHREATEIMPTFRQRQRTRKLFVISDDEDDSPLQSQTPLPSKAESLHLRAQSPTTPCTVLRSATKPFIPGIPVSGPVGLGLTQIFNGTMDEGQFSPTASGEKGDNLTSYNFSQNLPPTFGSQIPSISEDFNGNEITNQSSISLIPDSQITSHTSEDKNSHIPHSEIPFPGDQTQENLSSAIQKLTQDVGFVELTPIDERFVDRLPSNSEVSVSQCKEEKGIIKRKKLRRKMRSSTGSLSTDDLGNLPFSCSQDGQSKKRQENLTEKSHLSTQVKEAVPRKFDKKKSVARELINEQAEESEDEYAGLGGASDDETDSENDRYINDIIDDDESGKNFNEPEIAAFFADQERVKDEKQIEKLYNDITKGLLRRRRGTEYDLSDSDDGGEARQRRKRNEFARMRKVLLADERINQIATNPKTQAFLRAIEDHCSEDEIDFLHEGKKSEGTVDSRMSSQQETNSDVLNIPTSPSKRKFNDISGAEGQSAARIHPTKSFRKPSNISEIRKSLSSLIKESQETISNNYISDSDDGLEIIGPDVADGFEKKINDTSDPFAPRNSSIHVIDRMSVKRASTTASTSSNARLELASQTPVTNFMAPPLLRRATTNSSIASGSSANLKGNVVTSSTEREAGAAVSSVKRGGTKGSGLNYFARESERRAKVEKNQKRREQKLVIGAMGRRKAVDGLLGGGKFE